MKRPAKVRIRMENQSMYIEHLQRHLIDEILGCDRRVFSQASDGSIFSKVMRVRPWEAGRGTRGLGRFSIRTDGEVRLPRGLIWRLTAGLNERGIAFSGTPGLVIPSKPLGKRPGIIDELPLDATTRQRLKQILQLETTCVEYEKVMDRVCLMAGIAVYYSQANILIITKDDKTALKLATQLERILDVPISVGTEVDWQDNGSRIHVRSSSPSFCAKDDDWQVVIVDGLAAAVARQTHWSVLDMDKTLRFGFVQSQSLRRANAFTRLRCEALFGPCLPLHANSARIPPIVHMMALENDQRAINAGERVTPAHAHTCTPSPRHQKVDDGQAANSSHSGIITTKSGHRWNNQPKRAPNHVQTATKKRKRRRKKLVPRKKADSGAILERKRSNEWKNEQRNARIADVACAVRAKSKAKLTKLGCDALWTSLEALKAKSRPKVAIYVESAEHARELSSLLPKWMVLQHEWPSTLGDAKDGRSTNESAATNSTGRMIVTETYVTHRHVDADVLIVASGSTDGVLRAKKNTATAENGIGTRCILKLGRRNTPVRTSVVIAIENLLRSCIDL